MGNRQCRTAVCRAGRAGGDLYRPRSGQQGAGTGQQRLGRFWRRVRAVDPAVADVEADDRCWRGVGIGSRCRRGDPVDRYGLEQGVSG